MASIQLEPPSQFSFKTPDQWSKWKRRFDQYRLASGLSGESDERQVSALLYCMGEDAEDTLTSTNISEDDRKSYAAVLTKFDAFFQVRRNTIFERARFNQRSQSEGESVEQFITSLYSLAENCDFAAMKEEMIRDRIVVGIRDSSLSERMQIDADLTLEKAKKMVRLREAVHEQQEILKCGQGDMKTVDTLKEKKTSGQQRRPFRVPPKGGPRQRSGTNHKCTRCGKGPHSRQTCPARDAVCHTCQKKGHYRSQCFSRSVANVVTPSLESDEEEKGFYLNTVVSKSQSKSWNCKVLVDGKEVTFKVDTGAEVTVLAENILTQLNLKKLRKSSKSLCGPDQRRLSVLGELLASLSYKGKSCDHLVYVVKGLRENLLGLPAIQALGMLSHVHTVTQGITDQYPALFTGLGTFKVSYAIKMKADAQPYSLFTPRNVPLPLRKKVAEELIRMESLGVISRVNQPTDWCAGMVVVPKKSGNVRICVDFRPLNEGVLREVHPLPTVDETLAQLAGATVFSKLDANCGFWQIPLDEMSRPLITFITSFGRFWFNKLPFGICSAPECFQRRMSDMLASEEGVLCHMDDVLIFGKIVKNMMLDFIQYYRRS